MRVINEIKRGLEPETVIMYTTLTTFALLKRAIQLDAYSSLLNDLKFHQNINFDFLTVCHEVKIDEL